jgi:glutamyl-tRNA reductase
MIGLSHQTAPVELRERIAFTGPGQLAEALLFLKQQLVGFEVFLLSTCNRTELYLFGPEIERDALLRVLKDARGLHTELPESAFVERRGHSVTLHLFRVATGLESMVLGENDIVRQLKDAYTEATQAGTCGPTINALFHEALRVSKRARTELDLSRGAFSVGHAAVELAQSIFGKLRGRSVLILGAGTMSEAMARHLLAAGVTSIFVANRTFDRAVVLAEALGGHAVEFNQLETYLTTVDIVLTSTAAQEPVLRVDLVNAAMQRRKRRELFLIDIALPRDIDAMVGALDDVYLYNLDDLQKMIDTEAAERTRKASKAELILGQEALAFQTKLKSVSAAAPLLISVRAKHESIANDELVRLKKRLPNLSDSEWELIERTVASLVQKIAHDPTVKIREFAEDDQAEKLALVREIYGLESEEK